MLIQAIKDAAIADDTTVAATDGPPAQPKKKSLLGALYSPPLLTYLCDVSFSLTLPAGIISATTLGMTLFIQFHLFSVEVLLQRAVPNLQALVQRGCSLGPPILGAPDLWGDFH